MFGGGGFIKNVLMNANCYNENSKQLKIAMM